MSEDDHSSEDAPAAVGTITPERPVATVPIPAVAPAANTGVTKISTPLKPTSPAASKAAPTVTAKPPGPAAPPPPPFKPAASMPLSMTNSPPSEGTSNSEDRADDGASDDDFARAIAGLKPLPRRNRSFTERLLRRLRGNSGVPALDVDRHVAFDGYQGEQHDNKLERDRRYGTVYTVTEYENAYLVRLELPRKTPSSSLKQVWHLGEAKPEYDFIIELSHNALSIRGRLHGEALRRLAYVSPSFPSGFLTRIEFAEPVTRIIHRLRESVIEVIAFKTARLTEDKEIRDNRGLTAISE
jgi:hypothetical protein